MTRGGFSPYNARMQTQALPGFRDFYPDDLALRTHIFRTWRTVAMRYGFEEYDGPPLEPLDLYTAKSGDEIVGQLYNFTDKGERPVALRPEMTPTLARMVAAQAGKLRKPIRWFSIPQLFRYERQQRGRLREHFQLNCDLIGEAGPLGDAEIIALAIDVLRGFGLDANDVRVRLSDRRVLTALLRHRGVPSSGMSMAYEYIDKIERHRKEQDSSAVDQVIAPATVADLQEISRIRGWGQLERALGASAELASSGAHLKETYDSLMAMGLAEFVEIDLTIVRGLAYYTGVVFEVFDTGRTLRAICGGGRYDNLLDAVGGVQLPAAGFGMGDVVLGELLREKARLPAQRSSIDVFLAFITREDISHVLALAHQLRDGGMRVEYALTPQPIGKQLKLADSRNVPLAVMLGPDERSRGEAVIKDLRSGLQESVSLNSIEHTIKARLNG
ncbi:MAG TPA: histidine--tRNA ligase [Gemmatimonadales bacterium]|nr:histidine--tRNA ligase [Gemmatimonadales bacterium]